MANSNFDEDNTSQMLSRLPPEMRAAFAAACAERLLPCWRAFARKRLGVSEGTTDVEHALGELWTALESPGMPARKFDELTAQVLASVPDEDQAWSAGEPYAEDAAASVAYALQAVSDSSPDSAKYAARRVYEVLANYLENALEGTRGRASENVTDAVIAKELARQQRDLSDLISSGSGETRIDVVKRLRECAIRESENLFEDA